MITLVKFKIVAAVIFLIIIPINAQQQVHIPWPSLADSPWPILRGDMQGTGRSRFVGPRNADYIVRKDMPLGITFGPVIGYDDILFTGTAALNTEPFNLFYSLDDKLNTLWEFETESAWPNNSGPTLGVDSTIYFASISGSIFALDYSGNVKWKKEGIGLGGYPFISISKSGNLYISDGRNRFIKLDKDGNTIKDTIISNFSTKQFLFSVGGDTIYFLNWDDDDNKSLKAADLNLNVYWSKDVFYYPPWGIPIIDNNNQIYIYTRDSLFSSYLSSYLPDGNINWEFAVGSFDDFSSPTIDSNGNIILAVNDSLRTEVISLDYSGNENWRTIVRPDQASVGGSIISDAEGKIYLVSEGFNEESYLHCLDSNGEILWEVFVDNHSFIGSPVINSEGIIYVGGFNSSFNPFHTRNLIAVSENPLSVESDINVNGFELSQNYPNPFNPSTTIKYQLSSSGIVTLKVYDILGREVTTLVDEFKSAGSYEINFNAKNLSSGIYIYRITAANNGRILFTDSKQMILLK